MHHFSLVTVTRWSDACSVCPNAHADMHSSAHVACCLLRLALPHVTHLRTIPLMLLYVCCAGIATLAFSQGPKVAWKAALPTIVGVVGKEGAQGGKAAPAAAAEKSKPKPAAAKPTAGKLCPAARRLFRLQIVVCATTPALHSSLCVHVSICPCVCSCLLRWRRLR
jgi:hypothetical protein